MHDLLPVLMKDGYKVGHVFQYPEGTEYVYSNLTPRNSRRGDGETDILWFGLQFYIKEYMQYRFQKFFFDAPKNYVLRTYKRRIDNYLGPNAITFDHITALHDLGYLPLVIKALPEGALVPYNVPTLTIANTHPDFFWLTNMLETIMSSVLWKASTSATTAYRYRQRFEEYTAKTGAPRDFVPFQGHDFSFRGMCGIEDAAISGAGHLLSFVGTDTIPAIDLLENYYEADSDNELVGVSVPATEHSVMCMGSQEGEFETFKRLVTEIYPDGIVSIVSDTWDLWKVLTEYMPALKGEIMARQGRVVIRPDSGDPVLIVCGDPSAPANSPARKGVIELLDETFGSELLQEGYRTLDTHVGVIYGDGINPARQEAILAGLAHKGYASSNIVLGLGSFTYQYVTRDTDGWAMKATAGRIKGRMVEICKSPVTDNGGKWSAAGLLRVDAVDGRYVLRQRVTEEDEQGGCLETVFRNGKLIKEHTLAQIRVRVERQLQESL